MTIAKNKHRAGGSRLVISRRVSRDMTLENVIKHIFLDLNCFKRYPRSKSIWRPLSFKVIHQVVRIGSALEAGGSFACLTMVSIPTKVSREGIL